jgi:hypothetical protein
VARLPETFPGSGLYGEQRLRHVSFTIEPGEFSRNELVLRQWPMLTPTNLEPAYSIVLGRDVDLFKLEFWDIQKKDWVDQWKPTNAFPALVRVAIGMGNKEGLPVDQREIITRVIAPAAIVVPREYQMAGMPIQPGLPPRAGLTNMPLRVDPRMDPRNPGYNPNYQPGFQPGYPPQPFR